MKFTQIPVNTFKELQMNAGILVDSFNPATGVIGNLLGATTGGINFADNVTYTDLGEDIDNCPKNMMELKQLESHEVTMGGTFLTVTAASAKMLAAVADVDPDDETHIIPRNDVLKRDFIELWWIGDYSDVNTGDDAGFLAIRLKNALNTGGFQIQSTDKAKGNLAFTFTGHYSMDAQDEVPYEIFCKAGNETAQPSVNINKHAVTLEEDDTVTLTAITVPDGKTVTWSSSDSLKASVTSGGVVTGEAAGSAIITASITVDGVAYTDTCTVVVTAAPEP